MITQGRFMRVHLTRKGDQGKNGKIHRGDAAAAEGKEKKREAKTVMGRRRHVLARRWRHHGGFVFLPALGALCVSAVSGSCIKPRAEKMFRGTKKR
jgi:hypothetical protein